MEIEHVYQGESERGNLQDALEKALQQLSDDLGEGGVRDALASWKIIEITGQLGGIAGRSKLTARIAATRTPEWGHR